MALNTEQFALAIQLAAPSLAELKLLEGTHGELGENRAVNIVLNAYLVVEAAQARLKKGQPKFQLFTS